MPLPLIIAATSARSGTTVVTTTALTPDSVLEPDDTTLNPLGIQTTTFIPDEEVDPDTPPDPDTGGPFVPGVAGTAGSGRSTPGSAGSPGTPDRFPIPDQFQDPEPGTPADSARDI